MSDSEFSTLFSLIERSFTHSLKTFIPTNLIKMQLQNHKTWHIYLSNDDRTMMKKSTIENLRE